MDAVRRLLSSIVAAIALAVLLFVIAVRATGFPAGPTPPSPSDAAGARVGERTMAGMETSPAPSLRSRETSDDVLGVLANERDLGRARALVRLVGLSSALEQTEAVTVFAPSDEAFERSARPTYVELLEPANVPLLLSVVRYHIVPGSLSPERLRGTRELATLQGAKVGVGTRGRQILVGAATVTERVKASNGWVYRLDSVLVPPQAGPAR